MRFLIPVSIAASLVVVVSGAPVDVNVNVTQPGQKLDTTSGSIGVEKNGTTRASQSNGTFDFPPSQNASLESISSSFNASFLSPLVPHGLATPPDDLFVRPDAETSRSSPSSPSTYRTSTSSPTASTNGFLDTPEMIGAQDMRPVLNTLRKLHRDGTSRSGMTAAREPDDDLLTTTRPNRVGPQVSGIVEAFNSKSTAHTRTHGGNSFNVHLHPTTTTSATTTTTTTSHPSKADTVRLRRSVDELGGTDPDQDHMYDAEFGTGTGIGIGSDDRPGMGRPEKTVPEFPEPTSTSPRPSPSVGSQDNVGGKSRLRRRRCALNPGI